jgi:hypothetical protein
MQQAERTSVNMNYLCSKVYKNTASEQRSGKYQFPEPLPVYITLF